MGFLRMKEIALHDHKFRRYYNFIFSGQTISMTWSHHNGMPRKVVRRETEDSDSVEATLPKTSIRLSRGLTDQRTIINTEKAVRIY